MSVQVKDSHTTKSTPVKDAQSSSPLKKRKRDPEGIETSKKKKKPRTEDVAEHPASAVAEIEPPAERKEKKKKKKGEKEKSKKSKNEGDAAARRVGDEEEALVAQELGSEDGEGLQEDLQQTTEAEPAVVDGSDAEVEEEAELKLLESEDPSSFYSTRLSLYLSIPAVSLESAKSSVLAVHLAPLLLTYFPPAQGIVLGFSDAVLSAQPNSGINLPLLPPQNGEIEAQADVLANTADEFGVCWVWLTATFLVFRPERGDELYGWTNVTSEGFVGLVSYNYFQTAIGKSRIPPEWKWNGPSREQLQKAKKKGRKGRLRDEDGLENEEHNTQETATTVVVDSSSHALLADDGGYFADASGTKIKSTLKFRVADTEIVPAHDRHKWSLQIDGTLLDEEAERKVLEEERTKFERAQESSRFKSLGGDDAAAVMSGALRRSLSREGSVGSRISGHTPARHRVTY
ncbi:putative RNA polymerase I subunit Rpa43 [Fonsecaea pedrosoi]|nr:putative RNA polymerase I subunit Rpa43 [Fonsecaea pedrosoi]